MPPIVWIDGTYHDRTDAKVSVFDHGLLYGDGVFEGIRVYNRRVFRLAQHIERLYASAKGIWLEIPLAKPAMHRLVEDAVAKSGLEDAYIRLVVTRGVGDLGLDPRKCATPSVICIVDTIQLWSPECYEKGLTALTAATPISHRDRKSTRLNSSHSQISYAVFCLKKKKQKPTLLIGWAQEDGPEYDPPSVSTLRGIWHYATTCRGGMSSCRQV